MTHSIYFMIIAISTLTFTLLAIFAIIIKFRWYKTIIKIATISNGALFLVQLGLYIICKYLHI